MLCSINWSSERCKAWFTPSYVIGLVFMFIFDTRDVKCAYSKLFYCFVLELED